MALSRRLLATPPVAALGSELPSRWCPFPPQESPAQTRRVGKSHRDRNLLEAPSAVEQQPLGDPAAVGVSQFTEVELQLGKSSLKRAGLDAEQPGDAPEVVMASREGCGHVSDDGLGVPMKAQQFLRMSLEDGAEHGVGPDERQPKDVLRELEHEGWRVEAHGRAEAPLQ